MLLLTITAPLSKSLQPIGAPSLTLLSAEGVPIARKGAVIAIVALSAAQAVGTSVVGVFNNIVTALTGI